MTVWGKKYVEYTHDRKPISLTLFLLSRRVLSAGSRPFALPVVRTFAEQLVHEAVFALISLYREALRRIPKCYQG